jgi:16S rRNA processing protein RimM
MVELTVARVRSAHGLGGEVFVELSTGDAEDVFTVGRELRVSGQTAGESGHLTLAGARRHKGGLLLRFQEVGDRESAERLRGLELRLAAEELRPLDEDEFFLHDLVGYSVEQADGRVIGDVVTSYETGAQLLLGVAGADREILIPFGRQLVVGVDREERRIVIDPPPGLLED